MSPSGRPRTTVINFYGPELNELARYLANRDLLGDYVRPYANRNRWWERAAARVPFVGGLYSSTLGRRQIQDPKLRARLKEAGVVSDLAAAAVGRMPWLNVDTRWQWANACHERVRRAVGAVGASVTRQSDCVVAFSGLARPAFDVAWTRGIPRILNYSIAHHRHHQRVQREEAERNPKFASMWKDFEDWTDAFRDQVDEEIDSADRILVGSSYVRDTFRREGIDSNKISVVEYGVDLALFNAEGRKVPDGKFRVIFAGQISQRKGLSYLLDAFQAFRRPDTELVLVGNIAGPKDPLRPFAHLFHHVPHLTRPKLAEAYRNSDVFIFPSLVEGMPLVVLEAMASGLPVIATANGPADLIRDGIEGFIIPERDPEAIRARLELLYSDRDLMHQMGINARARALEYSWDAYGAKAARVLADCSASFHTGDSALPSMKASAR